MSRCLLQMIHSFSENVRSLQISKFITFVEHAIKIINFYIYGEQEINTDGVNRDFCATRM